MSKSFGKRLLAIVLSVLMIMTLLPTGMFADDDGETTATVVATQTDSGTLTILSGADFTDETLYLYVNYEYTGDLDSDYIYYEPGYLCDSSWTNIIPISSYSSCGGTYVISLVELAETFTTAGYDVANGVVLNYWGQAYSSFTSAQLVSVASESGDSGETTVTVVSEQTDSGTLTILSGADFTDETLYLYVNYEYTGDLDSDYIYYEPGYLCDSSWTNIIPISSYSSCGGTYVISLVELAETFTTAGYDVANGVVLNYWGQAYSSFTSAQLVSVTTTSGDDDDSGSTLDTGDYDFSDYTVAAYEQCVYFSAGNWADYTVDMAIAEALATEGSLLVITRSEYDADAGYEKFLLIDSHWSMSDSNGGNMWLSLGTSITKISDNDGVDVDCIFDNGTTVVYDGATVYAALLARGLDTTSGADLLVISNSGSTSYSITSITAYVPTSSVSTVLPWALTSTDYVSEWGDPVTFYQVAIEGLEISGWTTLIQTNSSESWYEGNLDLWGGFVEAMLAENACMEITSTSPNVYIFLQAGENFGWQSVYVGADSYVDNGDGTYTCYFDCAAALEAFSTATIDGYDGSPAVPTSSSDYGDLFGLVISTDETVTLSSISIVEGDVEVDEPDEEDTEFDLSDYSLWYYDEINFTSSGWDTYTLSSTDLTDSLWIDGAIVVITRDTDTVTFSGEDVWDKFGIIDSNWSMSEWVSLGTKTSDGCAVDKIFDNGSMVIYDAAELYAALTSGGFYDTGATPMIVTNSTADTYTVTSVSVYIPTATIIAANEDLIDYLSSLMDTDEVIYINQTDADLDYDESGYLNYFKYVYDNGLAPNAQEIAENWWTSLGEEASIENAYLIDSYVAPIAGTEDDPDGTDGSFTFARKASVGDGDTYVESSYYFTNVVIKATQLYYVELPGDEDGFTVTSDKTYAAEGEEVTLTLTLGEGYCLNYFEVYYMDEDGNNCYLDGVTDNGDGTYTFTMPAADVWLNVSVGTLTISYEYNDAYGYVSGVEYANEGETVSIMVYAYRGYEISGIISAVDENGYEVGLSVYVETYTIEYGNGPMTAYIYYFTMPSAAVTVTVPFAEIEGFTNNIIIINDNDTYSYIEDVDFTAEDVYLEITYTQNDGDHDGWEPGCIYACSWNWISSFPSYYESNGTYVISLADLAALAAENGYDANDGIMIHLWDDGDDDYVTITSVALVTDYHDVTVITTDGSTTYTSSTIGKANGTAYVTIPVDSGYALGSVVATDADGNEIDLTVTDCGEHEYTFSMPDADVTIEATLIPDSELTEVVSWYYNGYSYNLSGDGILDNEYTDYADEELYICFIYDYDSVDDRTIGSIGYGVGEYWNWLCDIPVNENGRTYISLSELAAAAAELGYIGEYYAYAGTLDWDSMGYAIVTAGDLLEVNYEVTGGTGETIGWTSGLLKEDHAITAYIDVESGYILRSITATDEEGNEVELTRKLWDPQGDADYTFTMPATNVTLSIELVSEDDLTTVVTELAAGNEDAYVSNEFGSSIFYSNYVDFTDPDLYVTITYTAKDGNEDFPYVCHIGYQDDPIDEDGDGGVNLVQFINNGTGKAVLALTDVQDAIDTSGLTGGVLCIWSYTDRFTIESVSIETLGDYEAEESSVGELITIDGVEYEVTWDTTTANPISTMHEWSNALGYNVSNYGAWDDVFGSFAEAVVSHIGDGSLVLTESEPQAYARLQLNTNDYLILETEVHYYGDNATYISIDEAAELAASEEVNSELTVDTLNSLQVDPYVSYDENGSVNISAVKILTPHEYEVDSWTWSEDYSSATVKLVCTEGTHTEYVTATVTPETTDATCTEDGQIVYNAVAAADDGNIYTDSVTVVLPATGHSYEAVVTDPTCEEEGYTTYTCTACGNTYTDDTTAAIGHSYGEPEWTWDGYTSATATFTCENDSTHVVTITATGDDIIDVTTEPTCEEEGETAHCALVTFNGETYSNAVYEVLEPTGHDWSVEYNWSEDGSSCTATHVCANDASHNVTVSATITSATKTDATCEEMGTTTYTATFTEDWAETQTLDVADIEATGHDWSVEYSWSEDGSTCTATHVCANDASHNVTANATVTSATKTAATCTEKGTTTYTATFDADWAETQTLDVQDIDALGHNWGTETSTITISVSSYTLASYFMSGDTLEITLPSSLSTDATLPVEYTLTVDGVTISLKGSDGTATGTYTQTVDVGYIAMSYTSSNNAMIMQSTVANSGDIVITAIVDCSAYASDCTISADDVKAACSITYKAGDGSIATNVSGSDLTAEKTYEAAEIAWEWADDYSSATATFTCFNDADHTKEVSATVSSSTTDATCEEDGSIVYTATVELDGITYTDTVTVVIDAIGHDWSVEYSWSEDGSTCTATHVCANDASHNVTASATVTSEVTLEATCETDGQTTYTATFDVDWAESQETTLTDIEATGHDWSVEYSWSEDGSSCTATHICANDETHNETATATITSATKTAATCEEMGTTTYTATFTEDWAETQTLDVVDIDAIGHDWSVEYSWSEDGSTCTATHVCANDASHNVTATATITSATKTAATCTEKGTTTYTATFDADWAETQTLDVQDIDALGHTYGDPEFTWDEEAYTATATFSCTVDGCDGSTTVTADVTSVTTDATCTEDGKTVYTAVVTFNETEYTDTYEVTIPATGHTTEIQGYVAATCTEDGYTGDEVCTVCGETVTVGETIPAAHSYDENGVCTVCGAKMDDSTETGNPLVTVESEDVIFASVLPSGLVTDVTVKLDVDGGTVVVSKVIEDDSNPHLVEHIADTLSFTLYNEEQGDDLIKDTNSFTITDTVNNQTVLRKASILFYGDIAYTGTSAPVSMTFTSNVSLVGYDIYVLHYTGVGVVWETVTNVATISGMTVTVDFTATSFSPYVVVAVSSVSSSSGGSSSHTTDLLLRIPANYAEVNDAIARASALDPADYENFTAVTDAINAVNWDLKALYQSVVSGYADAINAAIDGLVKVTTEEIIEVVDPIEDTDTDTEVDETEPESEPEASEEANPTTGLMLSLIPMAIAAMAAVSTKRK
ncbi:MAG: hypothetical protein LUH23_05575 [Oscillospiraceae bacterium]|nr:hypothetical protein [Oscillospiraceae bacterium]